ncbi:MAG: A24 family peptidase [candidate division Zixibacteria bacterium]|nr:A24 family peptidase [candidate division Zixibacteria bacterium]
MAEIILYIGITLIGLIIGSFVNVLIYRIPRNIGFVWSRSFCPSCKAQIKSYDNIPVISYLILGGKCRHCKAIISWRYPLIELLNGLGYLLLFIYYGPVVPFGVACFLTSVLIAIFFIDYDFQIIPDILTLPAVIVGLGVSLSPGGMGVVASILGLIVGGGALYLLAIFGDWLFKKESMGGGDIKMAAMLGAFVGWQKIILVFFLAAVIGLVVSLIIMLFSKTLRRTRMIPFGPFLATAAMIALLYGDKLIKFYLQDFLRQ